MLTSSSVESGDDAGEHVGDGIDPLTFVVELAGDAFSAPLRVLDFGVETGVAAFEAGYFGPKFGNDRLVVARRYLFQRLIRGVV